MFSLRTSTEVRFPVNRPLQARLQRRRVAPCLVEQIEFRSQSFPPLKSTGWEAVHPSVDKEHSLVQRKRHGESFSFMHLDISNVCILSSGCPTGRFIFRRIRAGWTRLKWIGSLELKVFWDPQILRNPFGLYEYFLDLSKFRIESSKISIQFRQNMFFTFLQDYYYSF